jgi:hypothetical protein
MESETIERVFSLSGQARLHLMNIRGSVEITGGDLDEIRIQATKRCQQGDGETEILIEQQPDGAVTAKTRLADVLSQLSGRKPCKVDYQVQMPRRCELNVDVVSSSVTAENLSGRLEFKTVSGSLLVSSLEGEIVMRAVSGDIGASQLSGSLRFDTVSGDVRLEASEFSSVQGKSVSGDTWLHGSFSDEACKFNSVSGNLELLLTSGGVRLEMNSMSGRIIAEGAGSGERVRGAKRSISLWGGRTPVYFNTISGDAIIQRADGAAAQGRPSQDTEGQQPGADQPEAPQGEKSSEADRLEILDAIEQGTISVEEGIQRLTELEGGS